MATADPGIAPRHGAPDLAEIVRRYCADEATAPEVLEALFEAVVFCERMEKPGFVVRTTPEGDLVAVYSSERALATGEGPVAWFTGPGSTIIGLLPEGCGVIVDPGSANAIILPATGITRKDSRA